MHRYIIVIIALVILILGISAYLLMPGVTKDFFVEEENKQLTVFIPLHTWSFEPSTVEVYRNDLVSMTIVNRDDIEHGFAIDEYHINVPLPPHSTTSIPVFRAEKTGEMYFYCSVICGRGTAESGSHHGEQQGRFDMMGTLQVKEREESPAQTH